jgi:hypothetical protein
MANSQACTHFLSLAEQRRPRGAAPRLGAAVPLLCAILAPAPRAQQYADERIPVGPDAFTAGQSGLVSGDIDGDGATDLIVRDYTSAEWVLRGGSGKFEWTEILEDSPDVALVDLNGDGRADLLTQYFVSLGWYGGEPGATFSPFHPIQAKGTNETYWSKAAADLNGDGKLDVVSSMATNTTGTAGCVRWFAGTGVGGFGPAVSTNTSPGYPIDIALGDFNSDGFVDVAGADVQSGPASVYYASAGGLAAAQPIAAQGAAARLIATGDFDADGVDDVVCYPYAASFGWFRGGAAGLTSGGSFALPGALSAGRDLEVADLEADGDDDVLLVESISDDGRLWRSFGNPGTGLSTPTIVLDVPCSGVEALEFDGRPGLDLAYTVISIKWPVLRPGDGQGGFPAPVELALGGVCGDASNLCAADIDGNGTLDLAAETGTWLSGDGQGGFAPATALGAQPSKLVDLNGDGQLDALGLIVPCGAGGGITLSLRNGAGFGPNLPPPQPVVGSLVAVAVADLDADGDLDLASAGAGGAWTHLNTGAGAFAPHQLTALPSPCSNIGAGDLNGDGLPDLARSGFVQFDPWGSGSASLAWGLSNGGGGVTSVQTKALFTSKTQQLLIDDLDGDSYADVAWTMTQSSTIAAVFGDGTGALGAPTYPAHQQAGGTLLALALADCDGDGARDLGFGSQPAGPGNVCVSIARRTASGFTLWRELVSEVGAGSLIPADFDADGRIDLAFGYQNNVRVALNLVADPSGLQPFGSGTFGCFGRGSLSSASAPQLGNAAFRRLAHNLPPAAPGWIALGSASAPAGMDPFGFGVLLHIDPLASSFLWLGAAPSDPGGQADRAIAVPLDPQLAGVALTAQALHVGSLGYDCSNSPLALVSSRGLALTIAP